MVTNRLRPPSHHFLRIHCRRTIISFKPCNRLLVLMPHDVKTRAIATLKRGEGIAPGSTDRLSADSNDFLL